MLNFIFISYNNAYSRLSSMRMSHAWRIRITPFLVGGQLYLQSDYTQQHNTQPNNHKNKNEKEQKAWNVGVIDDRTSFWGVPYKRKHLFSVCGQHTKNNQT